MIDFVDPNAEELPIPVAKKPADVIKRDAALSGKKTDKDEDEAEEEEEEDTGPTGPDPEEVREFFEKLGKLHAEFIKLSEKHGPHNAKVIEKLDAMADMFSHLKLPAKMVDH